MNKKIISLLIVAGMLSGYQCSMKAAALTELVCERSGNKLEFTGVSSEKNGKMMLKVYNSDYSAMQTNGFVFLDVVSTDENGRFSVTVAMPDTLADGSSATGEYIMVYSDGAERNTDTFMYTVAAEAAGIYEKLASEAADSLASELADALSDDAEKVGVDIDAFLKLGAEDRVKVCGWFVGMRTSDGPENVNILNDCIYAEYISVCGADERTSVAAAINPSYHETSYNTLSASEKEIIAAYLAGCSFTEYSEVSEAFAAGLVLVSISAARASELTEILTQNAVLLGIDGVSSYKKYAEMSSANQLKVNEKLVAAAGGSVTSISQLKSLLDNAVSDVLENKSSGKGSGSSGGSSSSPIVTKYDADGGEQPKTSGFSDTGDAPWARTAIEYLAENGIVAGYNDGRFGPNDYVTREAFVRMLLNASGLFEAGHTSTFIDVDASSWYAEYVACAQNKQIVSGITEDTFGVGSTLTRQDMAVIILRTAQMQGKTLGSLRDYERFNDQSELADYAIDAVKILYCANLINGMDDGSFAPNAPLTRAQAAKVLYDVYSGITPALSASSKNTKTVNLAQEQFEKRAEFLEAVGVLNKKSAEYKMSDTITLGGFVNMALNLAEDTEYAGDTITDAALLAAEKYSMLKAGFDAARVITVDEAVEILVKSIGYSPFVSAGEFNKKAGEIGLLKGIPQPGNTDLKADVAMTLLENATECAPVVVSNLSAANNTMTVLGDTTMLEHARDTYKYTGVVTGNRLTTIYSPEGVKEGYIEIDNTRYVCDNEQYGDYLGHRVTYYVREAEDDTVKYVTLRDENDSVVIESEDFLDISDDFGAISYSKNQTRRTMKINASPRVFYNGRFYGEYTAADFDMDRGTIEIVEGKGNDDTDMIFITSYETFVVDRVSNKKTAIFNKYSHSGASEKIDVEDALYDITKNGEEITVAELSEWDVLSVAATKNGVEPYYKIYVCDTKESAKTETYSNEDRTVESIGYIYDIAGSYYDSWAQGKGIGTVLEYGEYQIYYLDAFGRVAVVAKDLTVVSDAYAYVIKVWEDDEETFSMRYYDVGSEEIITLPLAEDVKINDKKCKNAGMVRSSALFDADARYTKQLIKYTISKSKEIAEIETATAVTDPDPTIFTKKSVSKSYTYENASFSHEMFLNSDAKVLCVPASGDNIDDYYVVDRSLLSTDKASQMSTNVTAYDFDEFLRSSMVVISYDAEGSLDLSDSLEILVVDSVTEGLTEDDEVMTKIKGSIGNYEAMEFFVEGKGVLPDAKKGDALYVRFNSKGRITHADTIFSLSDLLSSGNIYQNAKLVLQSEKNSKTQLYTGWLKDIDLNAGNGENIIVLDSETVIPVKLNGNSSKVIVYDAETEKTTVEDINALEKDDLIIVRLRYSTVKAIVAMKNVRN
ncbi:MAG: S-layer homology domain-containing protein [Clostridia bacterium]|nr:S-layer homology domain-containing protein [Clostridia bacterium]